MNETDPETIEAALAVTFDPSTGGESWTMRQWLIEMLARLWVEGEGFSGKRPLGNSGWHWEPAAALITAGLITGTLNEYGHAEDWDDAALDRLVLDCIVSMADA